MASSESRWDQAVAAYRQALPLYEKRAVDSPTRANRCQLADCQDWLGDVLRLAGHPEETVKVWRDAAAVWEKLVRDFNRPDDRWRLADRHEHLGSLLGEMGRQTEMVRAYRDAAAVWKKLVSDTNLPDHRARLAGLQNILAWSIVSRSDATPEAVKSALEGRGRPSPGRQATAPSSTRSGLPITAPGTGRLPSTR